MRLERTQEESCYHLWPKCASRLLRENSRSSQKSASHMVSSLEGEGTVRDSFLINSKREQFLRSFLLPSLFQSQLASTEFEIISKLDSMQWCRIAGVFHFRALFSRAGALISPHLRLRLILCFLLISDTKSNTLQSSILKQRNVD